VAGRPGVLGAAAGGLLTLAVFALGLAAVGFVARLLPGASLLVALMTYALQLLVLAVVVGAIDGAVDDADTLSRGWFAAAVIVVTLAWLVGQMVAATRQRIPVYDLSSAEQTADHPGGER
jgi:ATP synthase protein I